MLNSYCVTRAISYVGIEPGGGYEASSVFPSFRTRDLGKERRGGLDCKEVGGEGEGNGGGKIEPAKYCTWEKRGRGGESKLICCTERRGMRVWVWRCCKQCSLTPLGEASSHIHTSPLPQAPTSRWGGKMYDAFEKGGKKERFFVLPSGGGVRQEIGYAIFICRRVIAAFALPVRARIARDWK